MFCANMAMSLEKTFSIFSNFIQDGHTLTIYPGESISL